MSIPALSIFCLLLTAAAITDVACYRIPNILPLLMAGCGVLFAGPHTAAELLSRGEAVLAVGGIGLAAYGLRALGGGDLKLLAGIAFWTPFASLVDFLLPLAVAGAAQALATLGYRQVVTTDLVLSRRMPYAVSIAAAGFSWVILQGV